MVAISLISCNERIAYSGKIFNEKNFKITDFKNKEDVINELGNPNYIDPIEKKYYYYSEIKNITNFYKQSISNRTMIVVVFNENETIKMISEYDLNDEQDVKYIKDKTPNEIIKRGMIQKIFGGVGANPIITE